MGTNIYSPSDHVGEPVTLVKVYSQFLQVRLPEYYLVKTLATPVQYCRPNLYANTSCASAPPEPPALDIGLLAGPTHDADAS